MKKPLRFLTAWLAFALGLPSPALALRAVGLEESNQQPILDDTLRGSSTRPHADGLEEDPIAAALKDVGVAAVDVAADGTARLKGQVITIPPALKQPGFFAPGSRTIVARTTPHEISPDTVVLDQVRIEGAPGTLGILPAQYVDLVRNGITTAQALAREIAGWGRRRKPIVAVVRASRVPIEEARRMARTQSPAMSLIGVPNDYPVAPRTIAGLNRAAQAQGGLLYLSASYATSYRDDRVLLIAA